MCILCLSLSLYEYINVNFSTIEENNKWYSLFVGFYLSHLIGYKVNSKSTTWVEYNKIKSKEKRTMKDKSMTAN